MKKQNVDLKSATTLVFGPDDILFIGDSKERRPETKSLFSKNARSVIESARGFLERLPF